ncbi:hypothetical protein [Xanthocytophaga agilis]|uniref:Uncharacterized protein n=1 Tax=Xanthocytophaga agilis TaxID=3048010 RepID=A0AAE3UK12_9BACT|nr:hypothetical protein [Xanthocytophaga agilis]MDJ1506058.1 hypothetical protein [Xanthocytophaga agilis]
MFFHRFLLLVGLVLLLSLSWVTSSMGQPGPPHSLIIKQFCDSRGEVIFFFTVPIEEKYKKRADDATNLTIAKSIGVHINHPIPSTKGYSLKVYNFEESDSTKTIRSGIYNEEFGNDFLDDYMRSLRADTQLSRTLTDYRQLADYLEKKAYQHASDTVLKIPDPNNPKIHISIKDLYTFLLTEDLQSLVFRNKGFSFTLLFEFKNENTKEVMSILVKDIYNSVINEVCFQPGYYVIDATTYTRDNTNGIQNITPTDWQKIRQR